MAVAMQWLSSDHVVTSTDMKVVKEELLEVVFSMRSMQALYNEETSAYSLEYPEWRRI
jgi:hypothetical protein